MDDAPHPCLDNEHLKTIREHTDLARLFAALGLQKDSRKSKPHDLWARSPFAEDAHASFHVNLDKGVFYCFATGKGGGPLELAQEVLAVREGRRRSIYEVARWLIEQGLSTLATAPLQQKTRGEKKARVDSATPAINKPIRQNLVPLLDPEHETLAARGISKETAAYLGCGYLDKGRSPLRGRLVFQIRTAHEQDGALASVILGHIGRATTSEDAEKDGKWRFYQGFQKHLELYNLDHLLLDPEATRQAQDHKRIILVEGCFDVAMLVEAGIRNVLATFGAHLSPEQVERLRQVQDRLAVESLLLFYDRDEAGQRGQADALASLAAAGLEAHGFDWNARFAARRRKEIPIPDTIRDPADFSLPQLFWLRAQRLI